MEGERGRIVGSGARGEWRLSTTSPESIRRLANELEVSELVATLLANRNMGDSVRAAGFLDASLSRQLRSPMLFQEMNRAAARLLAAVRRQERVFVYADYDVDGITSAAALVLFLSELGLAVQVFIPDRVRDGYGLRTAAFRDMAARGGTLVVTADCGAAAHDELAAAAALGIDVIVCDHHQAPSIRPPAYAVLNPVVVGAGFPFSGLCAAGVVFYLMLGTRMLIRESGVPGPDLRRLIDLVALGTVADLVPLTEENRTLVKYGVAEIRRGDRPGLRALCSVAGVDHVSAQTLAFQLGPRLNASGRLGDATRAVALLTTCDAAAARAIAIELDGQNRDRRAIEEAILLEAEARISNSPERAGCVTWVLASEGWHPGVVGIVASRLVERYHCAVVLLAIEGESCRGSARGVPGVHLFQALQECANLLVAYGGHRLAAGLTVKKTNVEAFAERFEQAVKSQSIGGGFRRAIDIDAVIPLSAMSSEIVADLECLEPHGMGNPAPTLLAPEVEVVASRVVGEKHLKLRLKDAGRGQHDAIAFRMAERIPEPGTRLDLVFSPETDRWEGRERVQLRIVDFRNHQ